MNLKTVIFGANWSSPTPFVMTFFRFVVTFISAQLLVFFSNSSGPQLLHFNSDLGV